ncbi:MAG: hypothetical protein HY815_24280 [Candidatus Riflebacteria bacterium]|nr:hypothetical protein [Candidatus Riflebacteria bacterium]
MQDDGYRPKGSADNLIRVSFRPDIRRIQRLPTGVTPAEVLAALENREHGERLQVVPGRTALLVGAPVSVLAWLALLWFSCSGLIFFALWSISILSTGVAIGAALAYFTAQPACVLLTQRFLIEEKDGQVTAVGWSEVTRIELVVTKSGSPVSLNLFKHGERCVSLGTEYGDLNHLATSAASHLGRRDAAGPRRPRRRPGRPGRG